DQPRPDPRSSRADGHPRVRLRRPGARPVVRDALLGPGRGRARPRRRGPAVRPGDARAGLARRRAARHRRALRPRPRHVLPVPGRRGARDAPGPSRRDDDARLPLGRRVALRRLLVTVRRPVRLHGHDRAERRAALPQARRHADRDHVRRCADRVGPAAAELGGRLPPRRQLRRRREPVAGLAGRLARPARRARRVLRRRLAERPRVVRRDGRDLPPVARQPQHLELAAARHALPARRSAQLPREPRDDEERGADQGPSLRGRHGGRLPALLLRARDRGVPADRAGARDLHEPRRSAGAGPTAARRARPAPGDRRGRVAALSRRAHLRAARGRLARAGLARRGTRTVRRV
ncbi:MAG: hypothetical protein AVDCRST_MAG79-1550, partial [uncultured Thermoleophilia bacterium]